VKHTEIIEALRNKLTVQSGRHLYGILGTYDALSVFARQLRQARVPDGDYFPEPVSVTRRILKEIPDDEFKLLVSNEAKYPEPTRAHVGKAFEAFLRARLKEDRLVVLAELEMLLAYNLDLGLIRTLSTDDQRIILLLPAKRSAGQIVMFPDYDTGDFRLPINLIAGDHLWEIKE
jgi:hypothetical protein